MRTVLHSETRRFLANLRLCLLLITPLFLVLTWAFWGIFLGIVHENDSWIPSSLLSFLSVNGVLIIAFWFPMPLMLVIMHVVTYKFSKRWGRWVALILFLTFLAFLVRIAELITYHPDEYPPQPVPHWIILKIIGFFDRSPDILNELSYTIGGLWAYYWVWIPQLIAIVVFAAFYRLRKPSHSI